MTITGRKWAAIFTKLPAIIAAFSVVTVLAGCFGGGVAQRGWSGGTLEGNNLFIGSRNGRLAEVNVENNSLEWTVPLETGTTSSGLGCSRSAIAVFIYGSPAVSDNMVFVGAYIDTTDIGKVYSFIPGEAQPDRTLDLVRVGDKDIAIGPIVGSVVIDNGTLYFGDSNGRVYAVNERLQPVWDQPFTTNGKIWSTPAVSGGTVYIGSFDNNMYAIDAAAGTEKWRFATEGAIVATPVIDGATVYVGSVDRNIYALDTANGNLKWSFSAGHGFWAKPVVNNGLVYAPCLDNKVYILKASDGTRVAEINLKAPISSSPVLVGDTLFVATEESPGSGSVKKGAALWAIDITTNQGSEFTRFEGEKVHGPLATDGKSIYVHTDRDSLYGIDIATGAKREFTLD